MKLPPNASKDQVLLMNEQAHKVIARQAGKPPVKNKQKLPKMVVKKLPKTFQGADVIRGRGMNNEVFDSLIERKALDQFDATRETFLVLDNRALDHGGGGEVRCFADRSSAIRYARAMAHGNVDQRVLRVRGQILVVATDNEL